MRRWVLRMMSDHSTVTRSWCYLIFQPGRFGMWIPVNSKVIYGGSLWKVSCNPIQLRKHSTLTMVQYKSRANKCFRESLEQSQVELFRGQTSIVSNRLITYKDIVAVSNWGEWKTNFAVCQIENYTPPLDHAFGSHTTQFHYVWNYWQRVPATPSRDHQLVRLAFPQFTNAPKLLVKVITNSWSAAATVVARWKWVACVTWLLPEGNFFG